MNQYVQTVEEEGDTQTIELPAEDDGTLPLSTLTAQFPGATGLKHRNEKTGNWRGVRQVDNRLHAPDNLWTEERVYIVVYPKGHDSQDSAISEKRKGDFDLSEVGTHAKQKRAASLPKTSDLVILGLAYAATEEDLRTYFEQFGTVLMTQIKREHDTHKSKGYGFIRMEEYESQCRILAAGSHKICDRQCDVKLPDSASQKTSGDALNRKIFVGRCSEQLTPEDLRKHFSQYGEVIDVYIPRPFRAFAFVTFAHNGIAEGLCGEDHIIEGHSVHISRATQRDKEKATRASRDTPPPPREEPQPQPQEQEQHNQHNPPNMGMNFSMGGYPMGMNPAMFAAMVSQGMYGMMPFGAFPAGNQGYGFNQGASNSSGSNQPNNQTGQFSNPAGFGQNAGFNSNAPQQNFGAVAPQPLPFGSDSGSGWGARSNPTDQKDIKGTAGWREAARNSDQAMGSPQWDQ